MVYLGVDLHRKLSHVVALDEGGSVVLERRFDHSPDAFRRVFGELAPEPVSVVFEATYGWGWFADLLADAGIEAHMAHPLATKAISSGRVKNDAVDARTLAHLLRTNLLPEAWIAPPAVRDARRLVRMRVSLVRIRSRLKSQVHAICADAGVPVSVTDLFGRQGRTQLASLSLRPVVAGRLAANLRLIDELGREILTADRELQALFRGDDRVRRLMPIPGIGFLTAVTIIAEVADIGRFPSADRLASWTGLTPTEHSSADHTRRDSPRATPCRDSPGSHPAATHRARTLPRLTGRVRAEARLHDPGVIDRKWRRTPRLDTSVMRLVSRGGCTRSAAPNRRPRGVPSRQSRWSTIADAPEGRSSSSGVGRPAAANQPSASDRVTSRVPWSSSSSWTPAISSPWRVRSSSGSDGRYQSSAINQPSGRTEAHAARSAAAGSGSWWSAYW